MKVTFLLIIANIVVFALQILFSPAFTDLFALTPADALEGKYWQFITYMFLHGGSLHILLNMFVLAIFGPGVENQLGWKRFLILYFLAGLGSAFLYILLTENFLFTLIGASGAVFGVLTAYGFLFPRNVILLFFVPMPAIVAVIAITAFELFAGIFNLLPGIANFGHIGGIVVSVLLMLFWKFTAKKIPVEEREPQSYEFAWE